MTRALLVVLLLAVAGCGSEGRRSAPPEPPAEWTFTAAGLLVCPGAARTGDPRTAAWEQWCFWDCTTYGGKPHQALAVRYTASFDEEIFQRTGEWVLLRWNEIISTSDNTELCGWLP